MCWRLNHQNILEMAQGYISLSVGSYKYNLNHLHSIHPNIPFIHIQYKSKHITPRHVQSLESVILYFSCSSC
jgi:hypothetical protein